MLDFGRLFIPTRSRISRMINYAFLSLVCEHNWHIKCYIFREICVGLHAFVYDNFCREGFVYVVLSK